MKKLLSSLLLVTATAQAEVPNVFTPKTAAKADEVNENFSYLERRINQLAGVSDGTSDDTPSIACFNNAIDSAISYSSKTAALGSSFYVNGEEYKLTKFRVEDKNSGALFDITMPLEKYTSGPGHVRTAATMSDLGSTTVCADTSVGGASVTSSKNLGVDLSDYYVYENDNSNDSYRSVSANVRFSVVLGQSQLYISFDTTKQSAKSTIAYNDYDMSDNYIAFDPDMSAVITEFDNLIDYIQIQQVTP